MAAEEGSSWQERAARRRSGARNRRPTSWPFLIVTGAVMVGVWSVLNQVFDGHTEWPAGIVVSVSVLVVRGLPARWGEHNRQQAAAAAAADPLADDTRV